MNLAELRDAVYDATGFPVNDGLVTANFVDGQVNRALSYISNLHPWRWLEATDTTNTATVAELARVAEYANPPQSTEERIATLEADLAVAKEQAAKADALQAVLVDKGVIAEADVVAIAAPAEEVAIKR